MVILIESGQGMFIGLLYFTKYGVSLIEKNSFGSNKKKECDY